MRFDDLIRRPAKRQRTLTYTESLQAKLNAQMTEKPAPKFTALEWSIMEGGGSLPEPVTELFDLKSAAPLAWEKSPGVTYAAGNVRIGDKDVAIDVTFSDEGNGKVEVEFMVGGEFKITGGGGAQQVFATVIEALKKFVTENPKVQYLIFSADEYSRAKLYHMMALRAKEIGFHAVPEDQIEKGVLPRSSSFGGFPFVLKRGISDAPKQRPQPFNPVFYVHDMEHPEIDPVPIKAKTSGDAEKIGKTLPQFKDSDPFAIFASKTNPKDHVSANQSTDMRENFADGRNPQDRGDSKRHGINTKASVSSLRKTAKSGGRKGQLAHWLANMKAGRAKK